MTASQAALQAMRQGEAPALAIWKAAREYGTTTKAVARGLRERRKPAAPLADNNEPPATAWWND